MAWKWRWKRNGSDGSAEGIVEAASSSYVNGNSASSRCFQADLHRPSKQKFAPPAPSDATAQSFVRWMQENGGEGEHLQGDLYDGYRFLMRASGMLPMHRNEFGRALKKAGCDRWAIDVKDKGTRSKPYVISIPSIEGLEAKEGSEANSRVA